MDRINTNRVVIVLGIVGIAASVGVLTLSGLEAAEKSSVLEETIPLANTGQSGDNGIDEILGSSKVEFKDIRFTQLGKNSATLSFVTTKTVECTVHYGQQGEKLSKTATDSDSKINPEHKQHRVMLTGLKPNTNYQYKIQSTTSERTDTSTSVRTFATPPA